MKKKYQYLCYSLISILILISYGIKGSVKGSSLITNHKKTMMLGAYYFDGWTGKTGHITNTLKNQFPEREPIWGWITSTPPVMKEQIDLAAKAGIDFFSFCWYYQDGIHPDSLPLNHAMNLFLKAPNRHQMKFCLLIANHPDFFITPQNWPIVTKYWLHLFKDPIYLTINGGKPLIIFYETESLIESFGSPETVKEALESFRAEAKKEGLKGISLAACVFPENKENAKKCGFDILTGYNYHGSGFGNEIVMPIASLRKGESIIWNKCMDSDLPYIPVCTLNWDPRPWSSQPEQERRYSGYSPESVYLSIQSLRKWINLHPQYVTSEKLALLYAWNEYGEGGWLTPSVVLKDSLLQGVKKALTK